MPGTKRSTPVCPAQWVGGQRRKLVRRNRSNAGPPRSSTMPVLNPGSAAASLVSSINSLGSGYVKDRQSEDSYDRHRLDKGQQPEGLEDKMQFYPPSGAVKSGALYTSLADGPATFSPKLTTTDSRKKQGLFGTKKPKTLDLLTSSPQTPVVTSPLPVTTPSKAAKFFGLETKPAVTESPRLCEYLQDAGIAHDDAPVRPAFAKQHSLPLLIGIKLDADRQTQVEENATATTSTAPSRANKGLRMLVLEFAGPRRAPAQQTTVATSRFELDDDDEDVGYNTNIGLQEPRFCIPAAPCPVPAAPKRSRTRRKNPKDFERMSPITEASFESLRPAYREGEDMTELGVISEYEYDDPPHSAPVLPRSHTESMLLSQNTLKSPKVLPHAAFELDEADLSPTDGFYDEEVIDEDDNTVHPGTRVDAKRLHWQRPTPVYLRGPLQSIEDAYLDATEEEMRLEARKMTLARVETQKQEMDAEIAVLKREHERLKLSVIVNYSGTVTASKSGDNIERVRADAESTLKEDSIEDSEDLVSLSSSIDLDEKPALHEAKLMTFTRVTSGMVKLVDIPARKKKPVAYVRSNTAVPDKCELVECEKKGIATPAEGEKIPPASPLVTHCHYEDPGCTSKPKKSKLTRNESRLLIQNWISDYNSTKQRPISTRVGPNVPADQKTPPATFPKNDEALPTPPIKLRSDSLKSPKQLQKHQCINNGHIFHPVDLKTISDNAVINSLEIRPYLQTYTGVKQHVKIPVLCEKCGEDCDENVWECEIAVCRIAVCQSCAEDMEAEWQERAVSGWKYQ